MLKSVCAVLAAVLVDRGLAFRSVSTAGCPRASTMRRSRPPSYQEHVESEFNVPVSDLDWDGEWQKVVRGEQDHIVRPEGNG